MDFEGRSDGRSVKSILGHVAPLKLVCIMSLYVLLFVNVVKIMFFTDLSNEAYDMSLIIFLLVHFHFTFDKRY